MMYLGDYKEDDTVHFIWSTNDSAGGSITRATDGTVSVYKDNGVAQSTAGVTDTEDFDSLTGIHACTIDLSADAFYATAADYSVVLSAATIDGETVNAPLAHFSIENRYDGVADGLATYDPPTKAELDSAVAPLAQTGADGDTLETLSDQIDVVDGNVDSILLDTGTDGVVLADDAITSAKYDESTAFPVKSADTGATEIARTGADSDTLETLSDQIDGIPAGVWSYGTRQVTAVSGGMTIVSVVNGSTVSVFVKDTWSFNLSNSLLDLSDYENIALIVKAEEEDDDDDAILILRSDTGLIRIGGAAPTDAGNGTLTAPDSSSFTVLVAISETAVEDGTYRWWLKGFDTTPAPDQGKTLAKGSWIISPAAYSEIA